MLAQGPAWWRRLRTCSVARSSNLFNEGLGRSGNIKTRLCCALNATTPSSFLSE